VKAYNMDAREFVRWHVEQSNNPTELPEEYLKFDHCYMNLPMIAVEFLDVFQGLFLNANPKVWCKDPNDIKTIQLPLIHVYGFTQEKEKEGALDFFTQRIGKAMDYPEFSKEQIECFHNIRDVSGISHMYSSTFRLPYEVAMRKMEIEKDVAEMAK